MQLPQRFVRMPNEGRPSSLVCKLKAPQQNMHNIYEVFAPLPVLESLARAVMNLEDPHGWCTWHALCLALPAFGRYSMNNWVKTAAQDAFVRIVHIDGKHHYYYHLPGVERHRNHDLPAEFHCGVQSWCQYGVEHRDNDKPAVIYYHGAKLWYQHGREHRENDKPAVVDTKGNKEWWIDGQRHRDNHQPAVVRTNSAENQWWIRGKLVHGKRLKKPSLDLWHDSYEKYLDEDSESY